MSEISRDPTRRVLRSLTHGVYVLGVHDGVAPVDTTDNTRDSGADADRSNGMRTVVVDERRDDYLIVALAMQCSVEPVRVVFALNKDARVLAAIRNTRGCTLGVLDNTQRAAIKRYGTPGAVRTRPQSPERSRMANHPVAPECAAWIALATIHEVDAGDHLLILCDVVEAGGAITLADAPFDFQPMTLAASKFPYAG